MSDTADRWTLTPAELCKCFVFVGGSETFALETIPFTGPKKALSGTRYQYQVGVSSSSLSLEIAAVRRARPELPDSGDKRSGILVFDGSKIIASYVIAGDFTRDSNRVTVSPVYRNQGLAKRMIEQWYREAPYAFGIGKQQINKAAVKTFLAAHKNVVSWAVRAGKPVPPKVIDALDRGVETAAILAKAELFEKQPAQKIL